MVVVYLSYYSWVCIQSLRIKPLLDCRVDMQEKVSKADSSPAVGFCLLIKYYRGMRVKMCAGRGRWEGEKRGETTCLRHLGKGDDGKERG